jgi:DNA mismatch repair protein MutL
MPGQPPTIRQLPEVVANQIAAGEVVERPAAVVKELCENALDAGASRITVRIEDGGRRLVAVGDDGHGMRRDDLALALCRHATSKLSSSEDLFRISTLGFRGEALPSIAAVSEFSLASRPHDQEGGWRVAVASSRVLPPEPCAMACGTQLEVRNLFWNVPARLKFLKSEAAESGQVTDQLMRLALSHPRVAFRLDAVQGEGERTLIDLPAGQTLGDRVRALFGRALSERLIAVASAAGGGVMQISGFIAHPQEARPTSKRQYLFLNGRFVKDRLLFAAVREGFKGFLEPRLHGVVFLHLDIDPAQVDVNVHPTKSEVRFRREGEVFSLIAGALHSALDAGAGGFSLLSAGDAPAAAGGGAGPPPGATSAIISRQLVRPMQAEPAALQERFLPRIPDTAAPPSGGDSGAGAVPGSAAHSSAAHSSAAHSSAADSQVAAAGPASAGLPFIAPDDPGGRSGAAGAGRLHEDAGGHIPGVRRVLQLNRMFLLIETDQGIRLVDQHALHEKALFLLMDPARSDFTSGGRQELLLPRPVEMLASEVACLEGLLPELRHAGIEAEVFGPTTVLLRAYPATLKRVNWAAFFGALAEGGNGAAALSRLRERIAHSAACHGAVKAGQELSREEQLELVGLLYRLEHLEHCPHGRPTTLDLSWAELGRRFQR